MVSHNASRILAVMLVVTAGLARVQAAEKIPWEDLQRRYRNSSYLSGLDVVMRDGAKYRAPGPPMNEYGVTIYDRNGEALLLPHNGIARIKIWRKRRYRNKIGENFAAPIVLAALGCSGKCGPLRVAVVVALVVPLTGLAVATAPLFLAADGIALLKPAKVFDIIP